MKSCTYCGKEYPDDISICPTDGEPLRLAVEMQPAPSTEEKHSALGIASFAISIVVGCLLLAVFVTAGILNGGRVQHGQTYPGQVIVGFVAIFLWAVDIMALALGIAAVCQSGRKRLYGILGLVLSAATILGSAGLVILGLIFIARAAH